MDSGERDLVLTGGALDPDAQAHDAARGHNRPSPRHPARTSSVPRLQGTVGALGRRRGAWSGARGVVRGVPKTRPDL